ncbi:MAG: T9SS type A sorting domain-containing protein, partial [Bacteroidota bacterium]
IDGREYRSDSLIYFYTGLQHSYRIFESIQTDDLYETISGELVYVDSAGALQNTCRDTVLMTIDEEGPLYGFVKDTLINGIPGKFAGGEFNSGTLFRRENGGPYLPDQFLAEHSELYVNGIGLMYIYHTVFEQGYRVILEGYTKNGLTFGEVSDDSELNGGTDGSVKEDLEFFPNPAGSFLNLHFQHYPVSGVLSVYSADGSQVLIREFDGSQTDVSMLPAGLYLAVLSDRISGKKLCGKFLKK